MAPASTKAGRPGRQKLAAILMADAVGYSRMMAEDEPGTLKILTRYRREIVDPLIAGFRGRRVKGTGDGFLLEFDSAVDAVRCAVAIQQSLARRNETIPPAKRIVFRLGVNIGDVVFQDGDIFGHGVNVTARIEPLADPGGIALSRATYEQIRDRLRYPYEDRGEVQVKNIERPISVLALAADAIAALPEEVPDSTGFLRRYRWLAVSVAAIVLIAGLGGGAAFWALQKPQPVQPAALSFEQQLVATITKAIPDMSADEASKLAHDYAGGGMHRSLAVAPSSGDHRWTADWPARDVAEEKALERCQMTFGAPCAVIASDETVLPPEEKWTTHDLPNVRYAGAFAVDKIPGMRPNILQRSDVLNYGSAAGEKAIAIHPQGVLVVVTGAASKTAAEDDALKKCNENPARQHVPTRCLLYASGNQVILPLHKSKPQAQ